MAVLDRFYCILICSSWNIYVEDIMVRDVKCVSFVSTYKELKELLTDSNYRTYPLVDSAGISLNIVSFDMSSWSDIMHVLKLMKYCSVLYI